MFKTPLVKAAVLALALAPSVASGADPVAPPAKEGRLRGEVRRVDGKPIPGATIIAVRAEAPPCIALTATDDDGFLALDGVPAGTWRLIATAPGFQPAEIGGLTVGGPYRAVADLKLKPGTAPAPPIQAPAGAGDAAAVAVRALGAGRRALPGVRVRLDPVGHRADPAGTLTGADGVARVDHLAPGRWRLTILRAGWTHLVAPSVEWGGGELAVVAQLLPLPDGALTPIEELLPPPKLLTPP